MQYTSHLKASHLKELVQRDISCEEKLEKLEKILGLKSNDNTNLENNDNTNENVVDDNETNENVVGDNEGGDDSNRDKEIENEEEKIQEDKRSISVKEILKDLKGKELKLASSLITRIEASSIISWDYDSLEISVNDFKINHSNFKILIEKLVKFKSPCLPLGIVDFIWGLNLMRLPVNFFQDSDCLNLRSGLLKIKKSNDVEPVEIVEPEVESVQNESNKRKREESESENEQMTKKSKLEKIEKRGEKRKLQLDDTEMPRRSKRLQLKPDIEKSWSRFE